MEEKESGVVRKGENRNISRELCSCCKKREQEQQEEQEAIYLFMNVLSLSIVQHDKEESRNGKNIMSINIHVFIINFHVF